MSTMHCLNCESDISGLLTRTRHNQNRKFCNRSCAAIYGNKHSPKKRRTILVLTNPDVTKIEVTRQDIGYHARLTYKESGKPEQCAYCSYDKAFDVCHIKPVNKFANETRVIEINDINNLIALCKNHHWELDHDLLDGTPSRN